MPTVKLPAALAKRFAEVMESGVRIETPTRPRDQPDSYQIDYLSEGERHQAFAVKRGRYWTISPYPLEPAVVADLLGRTRHASIEWSDEAIKLSNLKVSHELARDTIATRFRKWPRVFRVDFEAESDGFVPEVLLAGLDPTSTAWEYWFNNYEGLSEITTITIKWTPGPGATSAPTQVAQQEADLTGLIVGFVQKDILPVTDEFGDDATLDYHDAIILLQTDGDLENEGPAEELIDLARKLYQATRKFTEKTLKPKWSIRQITVGLDLQ